MPGGGPMPEPRSCPFCSSLRIRRLGSYPDRPWRCSNCSQIFRLYVWEPNQVSQDSSQGSGQRSGSAMKWAIFVLVAIISGYLVWLGLLREGTISQSDGDAERPTVLAPTVSAPNPNPSLRHIAEKEYMLELINAERTNSGLNPVVLGNNSAAQLHAESSLENCFSAHWGVDGLKPYMRYTLAGGYQSNGENGLGSNYCITRGENYRPLGNIEEEIWDGMNGWMDSPGHRDNILDRQHKMVNIGLAWDRYNFVAVQHFEGDYVEYEQLPSLDDGILSLAGEVKNGIGLGREEDLGIQVFYDPPPHHLTRGQVSRTYCYRSGTQVASLRPPLTGGWHYDEDDFTETSSSCPNPYNIPADAPAPQSNDEAHTFWQAAYGASQNSPEQRITVPWVTATEWEASGGDFSVRADLSDVLEKRGPGVYTIAVWGTAGGEDVVISEYSIFYEITPPDTYSSN